jgi:hypothetical protein
MNKLDQAETLKPRTKEKLALLLKEANELVAICAASLRTAKHNKGACALDFNESMIQSLRCI